MRIKKITACSLSILLAASMLAACSSDNNEKDDSAKAEDNQSIEASVTKGDGEGYGAKEETVYVTTDAKGAVRDIIVSEWLKNPENYATLKDITNLSDIVNVKGDEQFTVSGDEISFEAKGNDIYYQGKLSDSTGLPVSLDITYKLDGEEIAFENLEGKSGNVTITISYTANAKSDDGTYIPFLAVTGMLLSTDNFSNINVTNGTVLSNGDYEIVMGMGIPGISENLGLNLPNTVEINADVNNYSVDMMMTVITNKSLAKLSTEDFDNISDVGEMISLLSESSTKLKDGAGALNEGIITLQESTGSLADGISQLTAGAGTISAGISRLASTMTSTIDELQKTIDANNDTIAQLKAGILQMSTAIQSGVLDASTVSAYQEKITEYTANANQLAGANAALTEVLTKLTSKDAATNMTLGESLEALKDGSATLAAGLTQLNEKIPALTEGIEKLVTGSNELASGMAEFDQSAIQKIAEIYNNDFASALNALKTAIEAGKSYSTLTGTPDGVTGTSTIIIKTN